MTSLTSGAWVATTNSSRAEPVRGIRPDLLVLASGDEEYRGYALSWLAESYAVSLLNNNPLSWEGPYIEDSLPIRADDAQGARAQAARLAARHDFRGVLTYHEPCVALAARIAQDLGLPHCDLTAIEKCRDKFASRTAFAEAGIPSARFHLVSDVETAIAAADEIGWPVVVKPRALSASFAVTLAHTVQELASAFGGADAQTFPEPWEHQHGVLVEEYLEGPEISVDSLVWDSRARPLAFARKQLGFLPHFEEVAHVVGPADQIVKDEQRISELVVEAHRALGLDRLATHAEVKLTSSGPRMVEINGRTGGDMIPYLARLALGVDVVSGAAQVAVSGGAAAQKGTRARAAGVRFMYARDEGVVRYPSLGRPPEWLHLVRWLVPEGTEMHPDPASLYFARLGYAIVVADSVAECEGRLQEAQDLLG